MNTRPQLPTEAQALAMPYHERQALVPPLGVWLQTLAFCYHDNRQMGYHEQAEAALDDMKAAALARYFLTQQGTYMAWQVVQKDGAYNVRILHKVLDRMQAPVIEGEPVTPFYP